MEEDLQEREPLLPEYDRHILMDPLSSVDDLEELLLQGHPLRLLLDHNLGPLVVLINPLIDRRMQILNLEEEDLVPAPLFREEIDLHPEVADVVQLDLLLWVANVDRSRDKRRILFIDPWHARLLPNDPIGNRDARRLLGVWDIPVGLA